MRISMRNIFDYTVDELTEIYIKEFNQKKYRAVQTYKWLYQEGVDDFFKMSDLPLDLRKSLNENFNIITLEKEQVKLSNDGTTKFLFKLMDIAVAWKESVQTKDDSLISFTNSKGPASLYKVAPSIKKSAFSAAGTIITSLIPVAATTSPNCSL